MAEAMRFIGKMFAGFDFSAAAMSFTVQALTPWFIVMLLAAIIGCAPISKFADSVRALEHKETLTKRESNIQTATFVLASILLMWCMIRLAGGSYNPFIYFRF